MNAVVCDRYGAPEALRLADVPMPAPREGGILIRVRAASLNALDWHLIKGRPPIARLFLGLRRPKMNRPGHDVAGSVESVGPGVTRFKPGDEVFGACRGSLAEFACARERALALKPAGVPFEDAAAAPVAGLTALQGLRDHGRIQPGQRVLINGAAGGVGTFAVQIAKALGAEVTGVCGPRNVETVRAIGADRVIDYTREDFTRGAARYDLIFDLVANHSFPSCRRVLAPRGVFIPAGSGGSDGHALLRRMGRTAMGALASRFTRQKVLLFIARLGPRDLDALGELLASGKVKPVIDHRFRLSEAGQAMRRLATGHACGKVVVVVG